MPNVSVVATARDILSKIEIFRSVKETETFEAIVDRFDYREYGAGDPILRAGDDADGMYLLLSGRARISLNGAALAILEAGDVFGEMALIGDDVRSGDVDADADCLCAFLSRDDFQLLLKTAPRIATNFMRLFSLRIRKLNQLLIAMRLSLPQASEQLAFETPLDLLRRVPIFAGVSDEKFLGRVLSFMQRVELPAGQAVFARDDSADLMYIVESGEVLVHLDTLELARLGPGRYFGEMALLDSNPRSSTVTTTAPTVLLTLTRSQFHAAVAQSPLVSRNILQELSERIRRINAVLTDADQGVTAEAATLAEFPEVAGEDLWVRDAATGEWQLPLSVKLTTDLAAIAIDPPAAVAGDDFERALAADAAELDGAFLRCHEQADDAAQLDPGALASLRALGAALSARLRTPLFPKKTHDALATALYRGAALAHPTEVHIVLASPTALAELDYFLNFARLFAAFGPGMALRVHLVRWENIIEVLPLGLPARASAFAALEPDIAKRIAAAGFTDWRIETIDVVAADTLDGIEAPADIVATIAAIEAARADLAAADPVLPRNLLWITGFYARQGSLQRLGPVQPLLDLALRTSVGHRVGAAHAALAGEKRGGFLLLTSELNRRFLPCYDAGVPIANIALG